MPTPGEIAQVETVGHLVRHAAEKMKDLVKWMTEVVRDREIKSFADMPDEAAALLRGAVGATCADLLAALDAMVPSGASVTIKMLCDADAAGTLPNPAGGLKTLDPSKPLDQLLIQKFGDEGGAHAD